PRRRSRSCAATWPTTRAGRRASSSRSGSPRCSIAMQSIAPAWCSRGTTARRTTGRRGCGARSWRARAPITRPRSPARWSAVSTLPPFYVQVLGALSRHVPVHMFALSPSHEYWAELRSGREALRALRDQGSAPMLEGALPLADQGNPLLASFGAVGRDFQLVL